MGVEKSLTERFANLIPLPPGLEASFQSEITSTEAGNATTIRPVRPDSKPYLPMTIELLGPKIPINLEAVQETNLQLTQEQNDPNFVGSALVQSDYFLESAEDYQLQVETFEFIEPLVLYINPTDISRVFQKRYDSQLAGDRTVIEHWGEEQDRLTASGRIGAAYTDATGLTRYFRRHSASYQQLMNLFLLYRNNGYVFEVSDPYRIGLVGRVQITYDTETWIGHFDTFSMTENADNPFTMEYEFEFTVREYYNDMSLGTDPLVPSGTANVSVVGAPTVSVTGGIGNAG